MSSRVAMGCSCDWAPVGRRQPGGRADRDGADDPLLEWRREHRDNFVAGREGGSRVDAGDPQVLDLVFHGPTGVSPGRMGNQHPSIAPYETLQCADGAMAVCCGNDGQFAKLASAVGSPHLADDTRFRTNGDRVQHRSDLVALLETALAAEPVAHWVAVLTARCVPAGPVGDIGSAFGLADELGLDPRISVGEEFVDQVSHPVTYSRTPVSHNGPPPLLGQHNETVRATYSNKTANDWTRTS